MVAFQYDFFQHLFINLKHDKNQFSQINFNHVRKAFWGPFLHPNDALNCEYLAFSRGYNFNNFRPRNRPRDG
jgi:hypothetical protein